MQRSNNSNNNNNRSRNNNTPGLWHFCYSFESWLLFLGTTHKIKSDSLQPARQRETERWREGKIEREIPQKQCRQQRRRRPVATPAGRVSDAASTSNFASDSSSPVRNTNHLPALTKSLRKLKSQKSKRQNTKKRLKKRQQKSE